MATSFDLAGILVVAVWLAAALSQAAATTTTIPFSNSTASSTPSRTGPPDNLSITLHPLPPEFDDIPKESLQCYDAWATAQAINNYIVWAIFTLAPWATVTSPITLSEIGSRTFTDCSTTYTGPQTVLCDGITRNYLPTENTICETITPSSTRTWETDYTRNSPLWLSSWSTANSRTYPDCTPAKDRESICYRLHSAYSWRTSQAAASANITQTPSEMIWPQKPECQTLIERPASKLATKSCRFEVDDYELYYWPSAPITGSSFCMNATRCAGGTRTIPWLPNTAVISGHTLTSPSVYHFMKGVKISTYIGKRNNYKYRTPYYNISSSIPHETILTFPQEEAEIWTAQPIEKDKGRHLHTSWKYANQTYNADWMATAPSSAYYNACERERLCSRGDGTISQAHFRQYAALSVKAVLDEWDSDEFKDCNWTSQYWGKGPWHDRVDMWIAPGEPWRATPIVTDDDEAKATAAPWARPGPSFGSVASSTENSEPEETETDESQ